MLQQILIILQTSTLTFTQTLASFTQFVKSNYPTFFSEQYIKISIQTKTKHNSEEAHIYLLHEASLLPNHFLLSFKNLSNFQNTPLKSNYPTNIPSLQTCELLLNQSSSHSPPNSSFISVPSSNSTSHHLHLTIATHNVRGFNEPTKREAWQDYCLNHDISIASITETKISNKTNLFFCNNNFFTYYWSNSPTSVEGTAIMIRNHLKPHVHSVYTHPGGAIALDIFF